MVNFNKDVQEQLMRETMAELPVDPRSLTEIEMPAKVSLELLELRDRQLVALEGYSAAARLRHRQRERQIREVRQGAQCNCTMSRSERMMPRLRRGSSW